MGTADELARTKPPVLFWTGASCGGVASDAHDRPPGLIAVPVPKANVGACASKHVKESADWLRPGGHDEAVILKISIEARWGPAGGCVTRPGPGQPVSPIKTDLDLALMAVGRHQGAQQFGLIPRDDDEARNHWAAMFQGLFLDSRVFGWSRGSRRWPRHSGRARRIGRRAGGWQRAAGVWRDGTDRGKRPRGRPPSR